MASPRSKEIAVAPVTYIPSGRSNGSGTRRDFGEADKRRIVEEACGEGRSVSGVARKYGIAASLVFRWRKELAPPPEPAILPVVISDALGPAVNAPSADASVSTSVPMIVERSTPAIEVELIGGRRVRFGRDVDPDTVRRLVTLLEEDAS